MKKWERQAKRRLQEIEWKKTRTNPNSGPNTAVIAIHSHKTLCVLPPGFDSHMTNRVLNSIQREGYRVMFRSTKTPVTLDTTDPNRVIAEIKKRYND